MEGPSSPFHVERETLLCLERQKDNSSQVPPGPLPRPCPSPLRIHPWSKQIALGRVGALAKPPGAETSGAAWEQAGQRRA